MERLIENAIAAGLDALGIAAAPGAAERLASFGALLLEKNRAMNLTAITKPGALASLHMLDCAALLACPAVDWAACRTLLDVGSGAGFPGVPLKILRPGLDVTLLDARQKRVDWLEEVSAALSLGGVSAVCARAEDAAHTAALRERFDVVAARAVAELRLLAEMCLPFARVGGYFLAMKGADCEEETDRAQNALERLGGRVAAAWDYAVPGTEIVHRLVAVEKTAPTPPQYPRRWAKMHSKPL